MDWDDGEATGSSRTAATEAVIPQIDKANCGKKSVKLPI